MSTDWDLRQLARAALIVGVVLLSVWMLWHFLPALAWACVLAIATWPLRQALANHGMGDTATAGLLTLIVAIVLVLPLIGLGIEVARDGGAAMQWVRDVRVNGFGTPAWLANVPYIGAAASAWWQEHLADPEAARALFGRAETSGLLTITRTVGVQVASRLTILVFTLLALFFLYRDAPRLVDEAHVIGDRVFGSRAGQHGRHAVEAVRATVNGLVLVGLGEGVVLGIAYWATGVPHAILFGLATGVLATVPFGAPLVFVLCALFLFAQSQTTGAIVLLIIGTLVVFVADHFIRPILIGSSTRLPFLWVLLGIFGGLETFGLIGLFLGPAIMAVLIAMWREGVGEA